MKGVAKSQLGSFCPGSVSFRNPVSVTQALSGRLRALLYTWRNWNDLPTDYSKEIFPKLGSVYW